MNGELVEANFAKVENDILTQFQDMPFWRVEACDFNDSPVRVYRKTSEFNSQWQPTSEQAYPPLASWSTVLPRLRNNLFRLQDSREIDLPKIVAKLSRAEFLSQLPLCSRYKWGESIQLIVDRSNAMKPFQPDQMQVLREILRLFPKQTINYAEYRQGDVAPRVYGSGGNIENYTIPMPGTLVVALSDLGMSSTEAEQQHWLKLGRQLRQAQCRALALIPSGLPPVDSVLGRYWQLAPWGKTRQNLSVSANALLERLLVLVSPANRIEPGFVRQVRRLIGADASIEAAFWQHPDVATRSSVAAALELDVAKRKREAFEQEDLALRREVLQLLRGWRTHLPREIWYEEIISLTPATQALLPNANEMQDAYRFFQDLDQRLDVGEHISGITSWFRGVEQRLPDTVWHNEQLQPALHRLWNKTHHNEHEAIPPIGYQPMSSLVSRSLPIERYQIFQRGAYLDFVRGLPDTRSSPGSWLGSIDTRDGILVVEEHDSFWRNHAPPTWARRWGNDQFGAWVDFEIGSVSGSVSQRLRWIPPGEFLMGSPESEVGRHEDEGPQHTVALSQGYWLFDTAVTQALWEAVKGNNPSAYQSPRRPVENVNWHDANDFIVRLNESLPGLNLSLPTEAQWEYACRAGTDMAMYAGNLEIVGGNNAPVLDAIAWYGGNSGEGYELEEGYDSSQWPEKQYPHNKAGTREVATKQPNGWGLYDMLGNVWEWCQDGMRGYDDQAQRDPVGPQDGGSFRVLRGGSCNDDARFVRAAFRNHHVPDFRSGGIGFRCARVQERIRRS